MSGPPALLLDAVERLAGEVLATVLPERWAHTSTVAAQARSLAAVLGADAALVEAAAWLHDIGYAPDLVDSEFHPLDGARFLRASGFGDSRLWTLVAHHSCAAIEAEERGLLEALVTEFPAEALPVRAGAGIADDDGRDGAGRDVAGRDGAAGDAHPLLAAVTWADMTSGPTGDVVTPTERIAEILSRYDDEHVVHRSIARSAPIILRRCRDVAAWVSAAD